MTDPSETAPDIDSDVMAALEAELGVARMAEVTSVFIRELEGLAHSIDQASHDGDLGRVQQAAHQLKGAALNMGAHRVSGTALGIERAAATSDESAVQTARETLSTDLDRLRDVLALRADH